MSLIVGQNSWVTISEADSYLTIRMSAEDWFDLSDSADPGEVSKTTLLVTAFRWLMNSPQLSLTSSLIDDSIKNAQIEAALFLLEHYNELNERRAAMFTGVEEFGLSKRKEKLNIENLQIPDFIIGSLGLYTAENTTVTLLGHYDV